jgi:hypothetical protein
MHTIRRTIRELAYLLWQCWHMLTVKQSDLQDTEDKYGIH